MMHNYLDKHGVAVLYREISSQIESKFPITSDSIGNGAITTDNLNVGCVTSEKINEQSVASRDDIIKLLDYYEQIN